MIAPLTYLLDLMSPKREQRFREARQGRRDEARTSEDPSRQEQEAAQSQGARSLGRGSQDRGGVSQAASSEERKPDACCPGCNRWAQKHITRPFRFVCLWCGHIWAPRNTGVGK